LARHKSAEKRARQNEKRRLRNASIRSSVKTRMKAVLKAVEGKNKEEALKLLRVAISAIAKAAAKGVFHKNTAARRISRLTKKVNSLLQAA